MMPRKLFTFPCGEHDDFYASLCLYAKEAYIYRSVLTVRKTAEGIEVMFGLETFKGTRQIVLAVGPDPPAARKWGVVSIVKYRNIGASRSMQPSPSYFGLLFTFVVP